MALHSRTSLCLCSRDIVDQQAVQDWLRSAARKKSQAAAHEAQKACKGNNQAEEWETEGFNASCACESSNINRCIRGQGQAKADLESFCKTNVGKALLPDNAMALENKIAAHGKGRDIVSKGGASCDSFVHASSRPWAFPFHHLVYSGSP